MFSTDFIFRQQENLVDNQKCQAGFRPLCNKILEMDLRSEKDLRRKRTLSLFSTIFRLFSECYCVSYFLTIVYLSFRVLYSNIFHFGCYGFKDLIFQQILQSQNLHCKFNMDFSMPIQFPIISKSFTTNSTFETFLTSSDCWNIVFI